MNLTSAQNRHIWVLASSNDIDSEFLHDIIFNLFRKKSLKKLLKNEAAILISHLKGEKKGSISFGQKKKIIALFDELNFTEEKRAEWLKKYAKYSLKKPFSNSFYAIDRITGYEANKLIGALVSVKKWKQKKEEKDNIIVVNFSNYN